MSFFVDVVKSVAAPVVSAVNTVIDTVVSHPLETAAVIATAGALAPEALGAVAAGEAAGATGLASLPSSVATAGEAFGAGGGALATNAALAAGAGASGTALADMAISGYGAVPSAINYATGLSSLPSSVLSPAQAFGTGGGTLAVDSANLAGAQFSNTALADQLMTGYGAVPASALQEANALYDINNPMPSSNIAESLGKVLGNQQQGTAGANNASLLLSRGLSGNAFNNIALPTSKQQPFMFTPQSPIQSASTEKQGSPYLTGQPQLLANLLKG